MLTSTLLLLASILILTSSASPPDGDRRLPLSGMFAGPANCSSDSFHKEGKCGGFAHGYLRCPKGYWCSFKGFCGTTLDHRVNSSCPRETREDPAELEFRSVPNDEIDESIPDNEPEDLSRYLSFPVEYCSSDSYHRWGKCGFKQHGYFRCPFGEWCSANGYCGKTKKYRDGAICPRETRSDPENIEFHPTPDDDPNYYGPINTALANDDGNEPPEDFNTAEDDSDEENSELSSDDEYPDSELEYELPNEEHPINVSEAPKPENSSTPDGESITVISADPVSETPSEHDIESSSRFNFEHGEFPLGYNGADSKFKFQLASLCVVALLMNFIIL